MVVEAPHCVPRFALAGRGFEFLGGFLLRWKIYNHIKTFNIRPHRRGLTTCKHGSKGMIFRSYPTPSPQAVCWQDEQQGDIDCA